MKNKRSIKKLYHSSLIVPGRRLYQNHLSLHYFAFAQIAKEGRKILDLGCGVGLGAKMLDFITDAKVVGVDEESVSAYARKNFTGDKVTFLSIDQFNSQNEPLFDHVLCHDLASFMETLGATGREDPLCGRILARIGNVLEADGKFIVIAPETLSCLNSDPRGEWNFSTSAEVMALLDEAGLVGSALFLSLDEEKRIVYRRFKRELENETEENLTTTAIFGACEDGLEISAVIKEAGMNHVGFIDESVGYLKNGYEGYNVFHPMEIGSLKLDSIILPDIRTACFDRIKLSHLYRMKIRILSPFPEFKDFVSKPSSPV